MSNTDQPSFSGPTPDDLPKHGGPYTQVLPSKVLNNDKGSEEKQKFQPKPDLTQPTSLQAMLANHQITTNVLKTRPRAQNVAYPQIISSIAPETTHSNVPVREYTIFYWELTQTFFSSRAFTDIPLTSPSYVVTQN